IAIKLNDDDRLIAVRQTTGSSDVLLATKSGMSIRFDEEDVRPMGRDAAGVKGIELEDGDGVVGCIAIDRNEGNLDETTLLTVTENGYGKRTLLSEYRSQNRGGKGLIDIKTSKRNGDVVGIIRVDTDSDEYLLVTDHGVIIRAPAGEISTIGRNTQGVTLISLDDNARVVSVARYADEDEEGDDEDDDEPEDDFEA
ncbi:MAG: DNA gyrase subunit A, partial [Myxococcales bacterium]|nr:DNA gyrase subunit A [Myxococcales bacterium]